MEIWQQVHPPQASADLGKLAREQLDGVNTIWCSSDAQNGFNLQFRSIWEVRQPERATARPIKVFKRVSELIRACQILAEQIAARPGLSTDRVASLPRHRSLPRATHNPKSRISLL